MVSILFLCNLFIALTLLKVSIALKPLASRQTIRNIRRGSSVEDQTSNLQLYNPLLPSNDVLIPLVQTPSDYVYTAPEVGPEIFVGSAVALVPIIWGSIEFISRIKTQRACLLCEGSGLVYRTRSGSQLTRPRKCWSCGGFIPWLGWKMFFMSTAYDPGNGGPLQRPSADYDEINDKIRMGEVRSGSKQDDSSDA